MEDSDVTTLQAAGKAVKSDTGQLVMKIVLGVLLLVITAYLNSISSNLAAANKKSDDALAAAAAQRDHNAAQDQSIALLKIQADSTERKTDAAVAALQSLLLQVAHNQDAIDHNSAAILQRARPQH